MNVEIVLCAPGSTSGLSEKINFAAGGGNREGGTKKKRAGRETLAGKLK